MQFLEDSKLIHFDEPSHKYTIGDQEFISATTFIKSFSEGFDKDGSILKRCAAKENIPEAELKARWAKKGEDAGVYGTFFHQCVEHFLNTGKIRKNEHYQTLSKFKDEVKFRGKVYSEVVLFDKDLGISGTSDLVQIIDNKIVQVHDIKTNEKPPTDYSFGRRMMRPVSHLNDSKLSHYFLQISLYLYLLSSKYGYSIGPNNYIFWLNRKKEQLERIKVELKLTEVVDMIGCFMYAKANKNA